MAATAPPIYDSGSTAKAAFLSVLTCTVAAICCKVLSSAFRAQRSCKQMAATTPPIYDSGSTTKVASCFPHLHGCRNLLQNPKLCIQNSKVLQTDGSNRASNLRLWFNGQSCISFCPHLHGCRNLLQNPKLRIQNSKVLQTDGSNHTSILGNRFSGQSCLAFCPHLHGCRNLLQNPKLCIQNSKVLQTDGSNHTSILGNRFSGQSCLAFCPHLHGCRNLLQNPSSAFRRTQRFCKQMAATAPLTQDSASAAKAALLSVLTCTVAAICCKVLSPKLCIQNPKVLQTNGSNRASNLRLWFNGQSCISFCPHLHGCRNLLQNPKLCIQNSKVLQTDGSNRASNLYRTPLQRSNLPFFLFSPARLPQSVAKSNLCISNSKVLQTDGSNRASNLGLRFNGQSCLAFCPHLHGCRNLSQNPTSAFRTQRSCKQMAATAPPIYDSGSTAKAAFLSVLTCTVAAICCKIRSSAFRTQRSCKQMAATTPPFQEIGSAAKAALLSVLTCTVAAICCKIRSSAFRTQRSCKQMAATTPPFQEIGSAAKAALLSVLTCTVAAICCKIQALHLEELKGFANRWQQPRL